MNHPLAIYTALYFAILFVTASIWSSEIKEARGVDLALLVFLGTFSLKMSIDDYLHFQRLSSNPKVRHRSLWFSLGIYLLLAASIANAASSRPLVAESLFVVLMLLGLLWIWTGDADGNPAIEPERARRHRWWTFVNLLVIGAFVADRMVVSVYRPGWSAPLVYALTAVWLIDAIVSGTFHRLARLPEAQPEALPAPQPEAGELDRLRQRLRERDETIQQLRQELRDAGGAEPKANGEANPPSARAGIADG